MAGTLVDAAAAARGSRCMSGINAAAGTLAEGADAVPAFDATVGGPLGGPAGIGTAAGGGFLALDAAKCEKRCPEDAVGNEAVVDCATAGEARNGLTPLGNWPAALAAIGPGCQVVFDEAPAGITT